MPKMTKTQAKRAYQAILSKSQKLHFAYRDGKSLSHMSIKDYLAIERICKKYLGKF